MPNWSYLIARLVSAMGSWLDASNLRNRVYQLQQENELLRTALDDIRRVRAIERFAFQEAELAACDLPVTSPATSQAPPGSVRKSATCDPWPATST